MTAGTRRHSPDWIADRRGGALTEYVIWTGVVALLALQAFRAFGTDEAKTIHEQGADVAKLGL
jgi:hypothetical protein